MDSSLIISAKKHRHSMSMTLTLHREFHHGLIYPVSLELAAGVISSARLQNTVTRVLPPLVQV